MFWGVLFLFLVFGASAWQESLLQGIKMTAEDGFRLGRAAQDSARQEFLAQTNKVVAARQSNVAHECDACADKDYQSPCPVGWNSTQDGMCIASASYPGVCKKIRSFSGADKREAEILCEVCWPCKGSVDACERNWLAPCPQGYFLQDIPYDEYADASGNTCAINLGSDIPCEQEVTFPDQFAKMEFARRCDVTWPCQQHCDDGVLDACPEDWSDIGDGLCVAPNNYKVSGCPLVQKFTGWSRELKFAFAEKCVIVWPCDHALASHDDLERDGAVTGNGCEQVDLGRSSCPRFWLRRDDGWCVPPIDLEGPCSAPRDLRGLTAEQKLLWASACLVDWRCVGEPIDGAATLPRSSNDKFEGSSGAVNANGYVIVSSQR